MKRSNIAFLLFLIHSGGGILGDLVLGWELRETIQFFMVLASIWLAAYFILDAMGK